MSGGPRKGQTKTCVVCNSLFYVPQYRVLTARYCSTQCQLYTQYEETRAQFKCVGCNSIFTDSPSRVGQRRKYCSEECKTQYTTSTKERRRIQKIRQKASRGSVSSRILRKWIWQFKEKRCQACGYDEHDFCLDLHHIDNNPNNNIIDNLAVLCCICHRKLHKGVLAVPLYSWLDKTSEKVVEVIRTFDDFRVPPTVEEAKADWPDIDFSDAKWERVIQASNFHLNGRGWAKDGYS